MKMDENKSKQKSFLLLSFAFRNRDFSNGRGRFKPEFFAPLALDPRLWREASSLRSVSFLSLPGARMAALRRLRRL
jgi:hypothetical protein